MPATPQEILDKYINVADADLRDAFSTFILPGYVPAASATTNDNAAVAYILGGQPGVGKTELILNADNFRAFHPLHDDIIKESPDYYPDLTGKFAIDLNNMLVQYCLGNRLDFILETTFSSLGQMNSTIKRFKKKGHIVNIMILAVNPHISYLNTLTRYENMLENKADFARKVGDTRHDSRYGQIEKTLTLVLEKKLYDHIYIYGRAGLAKQSGKTNGLLLKSRDGKSPLNVYIKERDKKWSDEDKQYFMQRALLLAETMVRRKASMDELRELFHYYRFSDYTW